MTGTTKANRREDRRNDDIGERRRHMLCCLPCACVQQLLLAARSDARHTASPGPPRPCAAEPMSKTGIMSVLREYCRPAVKAHINDFLKHQYMASWVRGGRLVVGRAVIWAGRWQQCPALPVWVQAMVPPSEQCVSTACHCTGAAARQRPSGPAVPCLERDAPLRLKRCGLPPDGSLACGCQR